jgi:hypothetical protein
MVRGRRATAGSTHSEHAGPPDDRCGFAGDGITVSPQVETDSVSTLLAQATNGDRACIVPHTWLWTTLVSADLRAVELVGPIANTHRGRHRLQRGHASNSQRIRGKCEAPSTRGVLHQTTREHPRRVNGGRLLIFAASRQQQVPSVGSQTPCPLASA